jgi:hypothetical protein
MLNKEINFARNKQNPPPERRMLSELDLKILWVARTLTNIDFHYETELLKLEQNEIDDIQKNCMKGEVLSKHHERRKPYVSLLEALQEQQRRQFFAA